MNKTFNQIVPTESEEQKVLVLWACWNERTHPELSLLTHIPNGGKRSMPEAVRFKAEGVRKGFPDLILPVARHGYHSLAIELKRRKGGKVSPEQSWWLENLNNQGWYACVCRGADEAIETLLSYLSEERVNENKN